MTKVAMTKKFEKYYKGIRVVFPIKSRRGRSVGLPSLIGINSYKQKYSKRKGGIKTEEKKEALRNYSKLSFRIKKSLTLICFFISEVLLGTNSSKNSFNKDILYFYKMQQQKE